jgi:hypothetical protein
MTTPSQNLLAFFDSSHYVNTRLQPLAKMCEQLAWNMEDILPDGPEKTAGLRKLLEAKDCFVRAALTIYPNPKPEDTDVQEYVPDTREVIGFKIPLADPRDEDVIGRVE